MNIMISLATLLVVILTIIAVYYHVLLYRKNRQEKAAELALEAESTARRQRNVNSIQIIARAVVDDQVSLTEASIRINALAQSMKLSDKATEELSVFRQIAEATAHIPILDRWKALSKKEKNAFDLERSKIEQNFQDFAHSVAKKIVDGNIDLGSVV